MKKLLILLSATALMLCAISTTTAQVRFAVKAGLNLANVTGDVESNSILPTFLAGARAEFGLTDNLGLGVGVEVSGKGAKYKESVLTFTANPIYLQVPLQLIYQNSGFFVGVGPYVGFGIAGNFKAGEEKESISFGNSVDDDLSPLDIGGGLEVGYQFGSLRASASYNMGFVNVNPKDYADLSDESVKHAVIGIALAYLFGSN